VRSAFSTDRRRRNSVRALIGALVDVRLQAAHCTAIPRDANAVTMAPQQA
jgi:hypothetical protein